MAILATQAVTTGAYHLINKLLSCKCVHGNVRLSGCWTDSKLHTILHFTKFKDEIFDVKQKFENSRKLKA